MFPGGHLDRADVRAHPLCIGWTDAQASARLGIADGGLNYWVAAVRECFEESGLLLAVDSQGRWADLSAIGDAAAVMALRQRLNDGEVDLASLCEQHGWRLATDQRAVLQPLAHAARPAEALRHALSRRRRAAGAGRALPIKPSRSELMWLTPADALAPERKLKLMLVTEETLRALSEFATRGRCVGLRRASARGAVDDAAHRQQCQRHARRCCPAHWPYAEIGRLDPDGRGHVGMRSGAGPRGAAVAARRCASRPTTAA